MGKHRTRARAWPAAAAAVLVAVCVGTAVLSSLDGEPLPDRSAAPPPASPSPRSRVPDPPAPRPREGQEEPSPEAEAPPPPEPEEPDEERVVTPRLEPKQEREVVRRVAAEVLARKAAAGHLEGGRIQEAIGALAALGDNSPEARRELARRAEALRAFHAERLATGFGRLRDALRWLTAHQDSRTGAFRNADYGKVCGNESCREGTSAVFDPGVTGLALLAFASFRDLDVQGEFETPARRCADHLVTLVHADGTVGRGQTHYSEAIVALALVEWADAAPARRPAVRAAENVLEYLGKRGILPDGAWRYRRTDAFPDTSVTSWVLQALLAAKRAGVEKLDPTIEMGLAFLDRCTDPDGWVGYSGPGQRSPSLTAAATFVRLLAGTPREAPRIAAATRDLISTFGPAWQLAGRPRAAAKVAQWVRARNWECYWWYYASHAFRALGGEEWPTFRALAAAALERTQVEEGHLAGSWNPEAPRDMKIGRLYVTAMNALALAATLRR